MKRTIHSIAILGSGVMGSRIACHFAGIGVQVLLLDMVTKGAEQSTNAIERNQLVNNALQNAIQSNPSPVFTAEVVRNITTGNFDDHLPKIAAFDWILEVVAERLDIKQALYEKVEQYRKPGTLVSSNTSGIPIHLLAAGRSNDFKTHFCGTHFFNPPRYLRLLEIIPTAETNPEIVNFLLNYGSVFLGKTTVLCKDTPAFIANRIGIFGMMHIFHLMESLHLSIDEIEALTGPIMGRPKSATFRTADVVGIDTLVKVAAGIAQNCPNDEAKALFQLPNWLNAMLTNNWLGDKTKQGFFQKMPPNAAGEKEIKVLNVQTMVYEARTKPRFATLETAKVIDNLPQRMVALCSGADKAGEFYRQLHYALFVYVSNRIPEITDTIYQIDDAMKAGFAWEIGAFEAWDALGVGKTVAAITANGGNVAKWVTDMLATGATSFYQLKNGQRWCYNIATKNYQPLPGGDAFLVLKNFSDKLVWKNSDCQLYDIGNDVLGLQWNTKMNSISGDVLAGIQESIAIAEQNYKGLVIANEGANFSAGASLAMIFMLAVEQEYEELDMAIRLFQNTMMRVRYSAIPVVVAPHGMALGGGCELNLHADSVCAAAETYIGLVELGVGVIPAGGGTKEFVLRASEEMHNDEPENITLKNRFLTIATAKVATSAHNAFELGILRKGHDTIVMNAARRISEAKKRVITSSEAGYTMPQPKQNIKVMGRLGLGALLAGINGMWRGGYATDHDVVVAKKLAYVMCGGDLSAQTLVSEQYLLDLEREAFLSLCGERKTLERIQSVLKTGKPIRN